MGTTFLLILGGLTAGLALGLGICMAFHKRQLKMQVELARTPLMSQIELLQEKATVLSKANVELNTASAEQSDQLQATRIELTRLEEQSKASAKLEETLEKEQATKERLQHDLANRQAQVAELENQLENERKQTTEKLQLLHEAKEELSNQFQVMAQKILEEKSQKFTKQNEEQLQDVLKPFKTQLTDFRKRVDDVYDKESKDRVSLHTEIINLQKATAISVNTANNLANALKGDNKAQGNWGELILERILEDSGLQEGREFFREVSVTLEDGSRRRPDVVIQLPEKKDVVIDSKVSMVAYEEYCSTESKEVKAKALKAHIQSLKAHIKALSGKSYEDLPGLRTQGYVMLFVPIEPAFLLALQEDEALVHDALKQNVMVVSPTTLMYSLKTIEYLWRNEKQNKNAAKIADEAGKLYDKFVNFSQTLLDVGDKINKAQTACEKATSHLSTGRGNLVSKVEGLRKLGVKAKKQLPDELLDAAEALPLPEAEVLLPPPTTPDLN